MPLFTFRCPQCDNEVRLLLKPEESKLERTCPADGVTLRRTPKGMSAKVVEVIDPGHYARRVEVIKK